MKEKLVFFISLFLFLYLAPPAYGAVPKMLNYQGRLTDEDDALYDGTTVYMKFDIFDAASGGNELWSSDEDNGGGNETCGVEVTPSGGVFNIAIGNTALSWMADLDLDFNAAAYYLEIKIQESAFCPGAEGDYETLSPRQRILSSGYSINADTVDGLDSGSFLRSDAADVFNEDGADIDLRFEGDTDANLFFLDASTDYIGIGTATPAQKLHVEGQCVTGDTLLPVVAENGYMAIWLNGYEENDETIQPSNHVTIEFVRIDQVKKGMQVLSLDEKTGQLVPAKIKGLLDMGVQPVFRLTTEDGRTIRTTGNHPYLVKIRNPKSEIRNKSQIQNSNDSNSLENCDLDIGNCLEFRNSDLEFAAEWRKVADLSEGEEIAVAQKDLFAGFLQNKIHEGKEDASYTHQNIKQNPSQPGIINHSTSLNSSNPNINNPMEIVNPRIPTVNRRIASNFSWNNPKTNDAKVSLPTSKNNLANSSIWRSVVNNEPLISFDDNTVEESLSSKTSNIAWAKIASIEFVGYEQVYDIEVEGTHNFVANGIIAHNTYISGNVGIGTTEPTDLLDVTGTGGGNLTLLRNDSTVTINEVFGRVEFKGNDSDTGTVIGARIFAAADGAGWTSGNARTRLVFSVVPNGSTTLSEVMRIDNAGNVGIGTTGPQGILDIASAEPLVYFDETDQTDPAGDFRFGVSGDSFYIQGRNAADNAYLNHMIIARSGSVYLNAAQGSGDIVLQTGGADKVTLQADGDLIVNSGNVGIGTTAPGGLLHVNSTTSPTMILSAGASNLNTMSFSLRRGITDTWLIISNTVPGIDDLSIFEKTNITSKIQIFQGTTGDLLLNQSGGNVGIGTTEPLFKLQVVESTINTNAARFDFSSDNTSLTANVKGVVYVNNDVTTNNYGTLQFSSRDADQTLMTFGHIAAIFTDHTVGSTDADFAFITRRAGTLTEQMRITSDGKVGIGTTAPTSKLHVVDNGANVYIQGTDANASVITIENTEGTYRIGTNNDKFVFYRNWASFYIYDGANAEHEFTGNVGIGTTGPGYTLDVGGGTSGKNIRGYDVYTHDGGVHSFSDLALKTIEGNFTRGLDEILQLNPIYFQYKKGNKLGLDQGPKAIGLVAQDVQQLIPEAVEKGQNGYLTLTQGPILYAMINAIQEQQTAIGEFGELLEEKIGEIKGGRGEDLKELDSLEQRVGKTEEGLGGLRGLAQEVKKLKTAFAQKVVAKLALLEETKTDIISPLTDGKLVIRMNASENSADESEFGGLLEIQNKEGEPVVTVDGFGNLTASGSGTFRELTAYEIIKSRTVEAEAVFADEITAYDIIRARKIVADGIEAEHATFTETLQALGSTSLVATTIAGPLSQDGTLLFTEGKNIDVVGDALYLQSEGLGAIDFIAGAMKLDEEGNLVVSGQLTVAKGLFTDKIAPASGEKLVLEGDIEATGSARFGDLIEAERASFGSLLAKTVNSEKITAESIFTKDLILEGKIRFSTEGPDRSAGVETILAGTRAAVVSTSLIEEDSYVFLTPQSSTAQTLYVEEKVPGAYFVVSLGEPVTTDLEFAWLLLD